MPELMPDITRQASAFVEATLDWVGMEQIALPISLVAKHQTLYPIHAKVNAYVDLSAPEAKGIHMSRLYLALDALTQKAVTPSSFKQVLHSFVDTHQDISTSAKVKCEFDLLLQRESLLSQKSGWKSYFCSIEAVQTPDDSYIELSIAVPYSSTCPCSAALARQLIQQAFEKRFEQEAMVAKEEVQAWLGTTQGIVATPHSQRSDAIIQVRLAPSSRDFPFVYLVDLAEEVLQTAVQTAVKREDEQEFARLNGQNLMFVEDSARKLKAALHQESLFEDYSVRVVHYESLHAHNAVAVASR